MCRWIAYTGQPIYIDQIATVPTHSLVKQSLDSRLRFSTDNEVLNVNGDGFGIGWYNEKEVPGIFKDESPAWSNQNLLNVSQQIKARIFFAHIRAATTGDVQRSNCHPFKFKNWMFQHNGYISDFNEIRQELCSGIGPDYYKNIKGNSDSEIFFHIALSYGLQNDPKTALKKAIKRVQKVAGDKKTEGNINLSCALSDGETMYTFRYAEGEKANTQFYSSAFNVGLTAHIPEEKCPRPGRNIVIVSEPLDSLEKNWKEIPENTFMAIKDANISLETFM